jgi:ABC-type oligopeptide transport system substrate-binding subunit
MKKKLLVSLLVVVLVLSLAMACLAGCNNNNKPSNPSQGNENNNNQNEQPAEAKDLRVNFDSIVSGGSSSGSATGVTADIDLSIAEGIDHSDDDQWSYYEGALGDFYSTYVAAKANDDVDAKHAVMAIAEAKLLESGVLLPTTSKGGRYAINKTAPYTVSPVLWGTDSDRLYTAVVTTEYIKLADRNALKALYAEKKGTGTYISEAKKYLAAHGYTFKDVLNSGYSSDPETWDITGTMRANDSEKIVNTYDGLVGYDVEGRLMGMLADSLTISEDGLKYTFHIREGVYWVDQAEREYAEVTADDFVYAMKRVLDLGPDDGTGYLVDGILKGASAYLYGEDADYSHVGVKAVSKYVLEYELEAPCDYFITMFNYNPFAPVCREYAESTEDYGTAPEKILYCGPFIVTNYTPKNKITWKANPKYWNPAALNIHEINWRSYADNDDATATYVDMKAGTIDGASLNTSTLPMAKQDGLFDTYAFVSGTDATTYSFFVNINREGYTTQGYDDTASQKTDAQKELSKAAFANANFRMAFARGIDRSAYNAIEVGEDCALFSLQNSYVPGTFVALGKDVTVKINGQDVTFKKGTYYGEIMQAQINADMGADAIKVWDPTADNGNGSSSGYDGWYNAEIALKYLNLAIADLAEDGIQVSAENPIHIDYPVYGTQAIYANRAQALKQRVAEVFEGKVVLDIVSTSLYGWYYVGYFARSGAQCNYDIYDCSGWGPDYGDPATYLNTMNPVTGDMIKMLGIY